MPRSHLSACYDEALPAFSDIRDGAIICLIANLMEQLAVDRAADLYHLARKVHHACPAFQTEVSERCIRSAKSRSLHSFRRNIGTCTNGWPNGQRTILKINTNNPCDIVISCSVSVIREVLSSLGECFALVRCQCATRRGEQWRREPSICRGYSALLSKSLVKFIDFSTMTWNHIRSLPITSAANHPDRSRYHLDEK